MADVKAVRYLLANNVSLVAAVAANNIVGGVIPQGTALPAIGVSHISGTRPQMVDRPSGMVISRVQVTVMAATYPELEPLLALVRAAVTRKPGTVNGVPVDCILAAGEGPDFRNDEAGIYMRSQDFIVHHTE